MRPCTPLLSVGGCESMEEGGTSVDAGTVKEWLEAAAASLREQLDSGGDLSAAVAAARAASEEGMRATTPLQASKGRASYLGERSIGHQDPGATSTALIVAALERSLSAR